VRIGLGDLGQFGFVSRIDRIEILARMWRTKLPVNKELVARLDPDVLALFRAGA
jgi:hypothetical protein